ncbi:MAG: alanine racemase [Leptolinea sp.]
MFLLKLLQRNPEFIKATIALHQEGKIPPNSYVLDLDTMGKNAALLAAEGKRFGLKVFPMTKQFGRNPKAMGVLAQHGLNQYVAVDMSCAIPIHQSGYKVGHIGHLVQIPVSETTAAASFIPAYWTVFNDEKAIAAAKAAGNIGRNQALLARLFASGDIFYMGHEGGFHAEDILAVADRMDALPNAHFAGITTFPALLFDGKTLSVNPTPNLKTLETALSVLQKAGRSNVEVNAPGTTSKVVMEMLANAGATQVEPGHSLTGTTPLHAVQDLPEDPAVLYLSEISHIHNGHPYCFGGGLYIDPVFPDYDIHVLTGKTGEIAMKQSISVKIPPPSAIDYYGILAPDGNQKVEVGDSVIFGFRVQAFVTRAYVVPVSGLTNGQPVVEGIYTSDGRKTEWPKW